MVARKRAGFAPPMLWIFAGLLSMLVVPAPVSAQQTGFPPVPVPPENPITEEKRILGKILYWDEQLSSDNTVACGTCHAFHTGGGDARQATHPGADLIFETADDVDGSMGVVRRDSSGNPINDPIFGFEPQVTPRAAMNPFGGITAPEVLWDGRAGGSYEDPDDPGSVLLTSNGGLENQATETLFNPVEMAKEGRTSAELGAKIAASVPWAQNADFPADVAARLASQPSFPELYSDAFGDSGVTTARTAMAIATYLRTLIPDQTPFDLGTLTANQQTGEAIFRFQRCARCHEENNSGPGNNFTDNTFRFLGLRPAALDLGREDVTGQAIDAGAFKIPTLRNASLKPDFNHTGEFTTLQQVIDFYATSPTLPNVDEEIPINLSNEGAVIDFIQNGLVDPRVANELPPFDSPTLLPEPVTPLALAAGWTLLQALYRRQTKL